MVNKVTLIGNLGRDPEVRHLESGSVVAKLAIATNENYKDRNGEWQTNTEWHNVELWGPTAERAERYLKKGHMVYVEGKIQTDQWQDKDGNNRYTTKVRALVLRSLERKDSNDSPQLENRAQASTRGESFPPIHDVPMGAKDMSNATDPGPDDLPF